MLLHKPSMYNHQKHLAYTLTIATSIIIAFSHCDASDLSVTIPNIGTLLYSSTTSAWSSNIIFQFQGVRFAESPTGSRRFKAPVPALGRSETQDVQEKHGQCPTIASVANMTLDEMTLAEDCLHLSIYTRNLSGNQPVMVYLHGGSLYEGAAFHHPPNYLLEKDVVLVVPQYRLGPLGFLSTDSDDIPGNVGLMDVILALEWVQKHIVHFGGSKDSVTLFGQSAGAGLIVSLLFSPATPPDLFHRVILQSAPALNTYGVDSNAKDNTKDIARLAGCRSTETVQDLNDCFMTMDVKTMLTAFIDHVVDKGSDNMALYGGAKLTYGPTNQMFPVLPSESSQNAAYRNISIVAGLTKHDGSFLLNTLYDLLTSEELSSHEYLSNNLIERVNRFMGFPDDTGVLTSYQRDLFFSREIFESGDFHKFIDGIIDIMSVGMFKGSTLKLLQQRRKSAKLFLYSFDYDGEFTRFGYGADTSKYPFNGGIHHSNDNLYVFPYPSFASHLNERDTTMAKTMVDFWTSFATTGVPTSSYCPNWPSFTTMYGPYLHINEKCSIGLDFIDEFNVGKRQSATSKSAVSHADSYFLVNLVILLKLSQCLLVRFNF
ncbi:glutactin-like [Bradysia coprophila]|uniref:glutactin-like n=1 Tax=Bradysia coprophila TaxID=38358 RepID=UPI00187D981D|nr:glutactin-like [Bradysia coprophila]